MTNQYTTNELKLFGFQVWSYKMGELVSTMIHLGDRLGLYGHMKDQGPMSSHQVASAACLDERLVREWLLGQAAAKLIVRHPDGQFELTPVQAAVLADEQDSIAFAAGAFKGGTAPETIDALEQSFRTGIGITYEQQGEASTAALARMTAPWSRLALTSTILPALDGVIDKLEAGATVVDIGCGGGVTLTTIAESFPNSRCIGYDPSTTAIGLARQRAADAGLENVEFVEAPAEALPSDLNADLVICFDCLHDMPFPDLAAKAVREAIAPDGTWLIKDIRSSGSFETDQRNPLLAMFYGFSITSCLQSALSEPGGMGLGTLGLHPEQAEQLARQAGFDSFMTHDFNDTGNLYYEVRI